MVLINFFQYAKQVSSDNESAIKSETVRALLLNNFGVSIANDRPSQASEGCRVSDRPYPPGYGGGALRHK